MISIERLHSFTRKVSVSSHCLMNTSLTALVFNQDFPIRAWVTQWYMQRESVFTCNTIPCHFSARLTPLSMASSLAMLCVFYCPQPACNLNDGSLRIKQPPIASELMSTHISSSFISMHHSPWAGSSCYTWARASDIICSRGAAQILSSQFCEMAVARRLMKPVTSHSHPHMGKCPTNWPHIEIRLLVIVMGPFTILLSHHHCSQARPPQHSGLILQLLCKLVQRVWNVSRQILPTPHPCW